MKSKSTATILTFFLGGIGVHRFYLGQTGLGFLYLIFFWTFVPALIAFVDFFMFLTMDEQKFNHKYNFRYLGNLQAQPTIVINNTGAGNIQSAPVVANNDAKYASPSTPKVDESFRDKGLKLYHNYDFDKAIIELRKAVNINPKDAESHFVLACIYSIIEKTDNSFFHLEKAIESGYTNLEEIQNHDHLSYLRTQDKFKEFSNNGYKLLRSNLISPASPNINTSIIDQIEKLAQLRDKGAITDVEFQNQKSKLLS